MGTWHIGTSQSIHSADPSFRVKPLKSPLNIYCRSKQKKRNSDRNSNLFYLFRCCFKKLTNYGTLRGKNRERRSKVVSALLQPPWSPVSSLGLGRSLHLPAEAQWAGVQQSQLSEKLLFSYFIKTKHHKVGLNGHLPRQRSVCPLLVISAG